VRVQTATHNQYGQLREGTYLSLKAPLVPINLTSESQKNHPIAGNQFISLLFPHLNKDHNDSAQDAMAKMDFYGVKWTEQYPIQALVLAYLPSVIDNKGSKLKDDPDPNHWQRLYGLLVRRTQSNNGGYERVGYFRTRDNLLEKEACQIVKDQPIVDITLY
jgi:hypothetical protein